MATLYNFNCARYLFRWTIQWIENLDDNDRIKLLSGSNVYGETILHYCPFFTNPELIKTVLSLYPNQEEKEKALLCQTNNGITPFHKAYTSNNSAIGRIIWKNVKSFENKLKLINTECFSFRSNVESYGVNLFLQNWMDLLRDLLKSMKEKYISDPTLLIPAFYIAVKANDISFAKFIVSKVNKKDSDAVLKFVTTKLSSMNNENCLHFAA